MAYATVADLIARFSELEIAQLTDSESRTDVISSVAQAALDEASAEIDSYLSGVYALPIVGAIPARLSAVCLDIARFRLYGNQPLEVVRQRYLDAVAWLKLVAQGTARLSLAPRNRRRSPPVWPIAPR
jgi:phage gp36-like protein